MNIPQYKTTRVNLSEYEKYLHFVEVIDSYKFYSDGKNGRFELRILFTRLKMDSHMNNFNLGFGVWDKIGKDSTRIFKIVSGC